MGTLIPLGEWEAYAACRETPLPLFFPTRGDSETPAFIRRFCNLCPVKAECLEYALQQRERHGIWGGTTEKERRALQALRRRGVSVEAIVERTMAGEMDEAMISRRTRRRAS